ncbi:MAG: 2-oxoacid:acceptor oxidoreductase family protein [Myxococcales bacterium]|nr:2-oxoacid:acceptor oxidoreductase family protein [Myxococcales bacterium]
MEIRLHGRGGQGGVTCAKLLAAVYARLGKAVQTFGDYAGERSGAPIRAYTRVSDSPISNRNKLYQPDHLVVLDPTLLGPEVVSGLAEGGTLLLNTPLSPEAMAAQFGRFRLATVDATAIARKHGIGTRSVVIVNTTLAGAFARALDLPLEVLEAAYRELGFESNVPAAREAYSALRVREAPAGGGRLPRPAVLPGLPAVLPLSEHKEGPPTGLKTGSWRTQAPFYLRNPAPCSVRCPAGNDVVGFVQALARSGEAAAAEVLGRTTPLSAVCGRVCPAPCMEGCNRRELDGAVNVRGLERWIAERVPVAVRAAPAHPSPRRIAIVGGGPAGLSAAYVLATAGHRPIIFEAERELGGVLRTGIPTYRLSRAALDGEIDSILRLGVEVRSGQKVDRARIPELARAHDALLIATGLQRLRRVDGPGEALSGVEQGIHFLRRINLGEKARLSGAVVVLGGGNTAMDCARSALRAGAAKVTVVYRRTRAEMPAIAEEIDQAVEEGVELVFLRQPLGFAGAGKLEAVELAEVELGPPDASGRRRPVTTDRKTSLGCDLALLALGQSADASLLPAGWKLEAGRAHADGRPLNVFAAGDFSTGEGTVAHAIGDGRRAAQRALAALGLEAEVWAPPDAPKAVRPQDVRMGHFEGRPPAHEPTAPAAERVHNFEEVGRGLRDGAEARRCFSCGDCTSCDTCLVYCPEGIIRRKGTAYEVDLAFCKGCGICVAECPRKAMEMRAS